MSTYSECNSHPIIIISFYCDLPNIRDWCLYVPPAIISRFYKNIKQTQPMSTGVCNVTFEEIVL